LNRAVGPRKEEEEKKKKKKQIDKYKNATVDDQEFERVRFQLSGI
jgi:hypothetical protein